MTFSGPVSGDQEADGQAGPAGAPPAAMVPHFHSLPQNRPFSTCWGEACVTEPAGLPVQASGAVISPRVSRLTVIRPRPSLREERAVGAQWTHSQFGSGLSVCRVKNAVNWVTWAISFRFI